MERWLLGVTLILTVGLVTWTLWSLRSGFDFTDGSAYLTAIQDPARHAETHSLFGFFWHPFYLLVGGDIFALRVINVLLLLGSGWLLAHQLLHTALPTRRFLSFRLAITSAAIATSTLALLATYWIPTPGYNSLNLIGLCAALTGASLARREANRSSIIGWLIIAVGGWMTFMARPTTAALLAVLLLAFLGLTKRISARLLGLSVGVSASLVAATALITAGSIGEFVSRLQTAATRLAILDHDPVVLLERFRDGLIAGPFLAPEILAFMVGLALVTCLSILLLASASRWMTLVGGLLTTALAAYVGVLATGNGPVALPTVGFTRGAMLFTPALAAIAAGVVLAIRSKTRPSWESVGFTLMLLALPFVFALGSNNNIWGQAGAAGMFWILAGALLLASCGEQPRSTLRLLPVAVTTLLVMTSLIQLSTANPYRQPQALHENATRVVIGPQGASLLFPHSVAEYITKLRKSAYEAGFERGTPMIDLTGGSPGSLFVLDATTLGDIYLPGGYENSAEFAELQLSDETCSDLARAWVLKDWNGPRAQSSRVEKSFGADLKSDYDLVGKVITVEGNRHDLLRPSRTPARAERACETARAGQSE